MRTPESKYEGLYDSDTEIFNLLEEYEYIHPKDYKHEPPKVNIIILDDLLGSDALTRKTQSVLTNVMIKNRHIGVNFAVLVQSIKAVPKTIRMNCSVFQLAKFGSKKNVLLDIYEEVSNIITGEDLEEIHRSGTEAGLLGIYNFPGSVYATDGSNDGGVMGAGFFKLDEHRGGCCQLGRGEEGNSSHRAELGKASRRLQETTR